MSIVIEVKNLTKEYLFFKKDYKKLFWVFTGKGFFSAKKVLKNVNFTVSKGEIVGILGKNGAGKSTLMSIVAGIIYPTSGTVKTTGKVGALINLNAGFNGDSTGRENIYYKANILGITRPEIDEIMDDIMNFADVGEYFDMPIRTYSSGMRARLGFSLATFLNPDVLIIDEVFAVGDKDFKIKSAKKTKEMFSQGKSILFSSHSESLIKEFCSRVIYIKKGKIVFDGDVEEGIALYNSSI